MKNQVTRCAKNAGAGIQVSVNIGPREITQDEVGTSKGVVMAVDGVVVAREDPRDPNPQVAPNKRVKCKWVKA